MSRAPAGPRNFRWAPAVLAALVLGAALTTFVIDVVAVWAAGHSLIWPYRSMARQMRHTTWSDTPILIIAIGIGVVGLLLLLLALSPGKRKLLAMRTDQPALAVGISGRHVCRALYQSVVGLDGVTRTSVTLNGHKARIDVTTPYDDSGPLRTVATGAASACLETLQLERVIRPEVRLHLRRDSA